MHRARISRARSGPSRRLRHPSWLVSPITKGFAFGGKLLQQRRRLPRIRLIACREFAHRAQNAGEADRIRVKQRATAKIRKSVADKIYDVNVRGAQRNSLF